MAATKLWLLCILALQHIANTIQELQVRLVGVSLDRCNERPRHGTRRLRSNRRICTGLVVSTTAPHDDICRARLGALGFLVRLVTIHGDVSQLLERAENAARVAAGVRHAHLEKVLARFFGKIGLFECALGGVNIWQVHARARVAAVEDSRQSHTGFEGSHANGMDLIVDNVTILHVVDRVYNFVVAVFLVTVEILCLAAVTYT